MPSIVRGDDNAASLTSSQQSFPRVVTMSYKIHLNDITAQYTTIAIPRVLFIFVRLDRHPTRDNDWRSVRGRRRGVDLQMSMREHERTFNHTVANFFFLQTYVFIVSKHCMRVFFCHLLFLDCRFTHPRCSTHVYRPPRMRRSYLQPEMQFQGHR